MNDERQEFLSGLQLSAVNHFSHIILINTNSVDFRF